ncbi:phage tail sheath family protein [Cohnella silvisoli]|uniref:Phage tail sheath family protein n=1 Tax=Cohnella silvisoli TaxID=2873699 RepID=A0ABV1L256_9BACL|nr:phage tail sheath family protein [Cohnella silvisoli]MCD9025749.1 phage tail sheath family protein [Cohnella silvisoli]
MGGNWSATDKPVLPGFFLNFQAAALNAIVPGSQGIVIVPVRANWGPVGQFVEIASEKELVDAYTVDETGGATAYTSIRLALLGAPQKVIGYRLAASAAAATITLQDTTGSPVNVLKIDAKYPGSRGNTFKVTVAVNPIDSAKKDIKLFEGTTLLRTFTFTSGTVAAAVDAINSDTSNQWIVATKLVDGNGTLANVSTQSFTGGTSGIAGIANSDYTNALAAFETQTFHVLALDGLSDSALHTSVVAWVSRVRSEGKGIIAVLGGSASDDIASDAVSKATTRSATYNHEGIVNVGSGAKLDGVSLSSAQISCFVAGLIAGKALNQSTTYAIAPFVDVTRRWTRSEQELAIKGGVFLLYHDGRQVKVLRGMNSLVTLRTGQSKLWKKIRSTRVMDAINADLQRTAEDSYIGKVNNTEEGRLALISACKQYLQTLASSGVIEQAGFNVILDPNYYATNASQTPEPDQVFLQWTAKLTDTMEQIFGTFIVQ